MTSRDIISTRSQNKKAMSKNRLQTVIKGSWRVALVAAAVVSLSSFTYMNVHADQFDEQIKALENANSQAQGSVNSLLSQAQSYEGAIAALNSQIYGLQAELNANTARQAETEQKIVEAQTKLDQQKAYLSENIRTMYVDGQMSTIEELATSKNLSEYVDREEYRTSLQGKLDDMIKQIAALKQDLQKQKQELEVIVNTQTAQRNELASAQAEQQSLLNYNESQQAEYNSQISANSNRISDLRRQQIAANARFTGGSAGTGPTCGGGYPGKWCNIPMDSVLDDWGMYNRECVSYTAWKVAATGRYMPGWGWSARGNANQWDDNAIAAGIPTDTNPRAGDVAISNNGFYGHAMYVESVNGDGSINISQYNAAWDGRYSTKTISPSGLLFIHF